MTQDNQNPQALQVQTQAPLASMSLRRDGVFMPQTMSELIEFSTTISESRMVPKHFENNPGAVVVAIQMGYELGLTPMAAIRSIYVVNGRPTLWGDSMLALVRSHPECEDVVEWSKNGAAYCKVVRRGRTPVERSFSREQAQTASLLGKAGPWKQYPDRMLQMRARAFALRDSFPDALTGIYSTEEANDIVDASFDNMPQGLAEGSHSFGFGAKKQEPEATKEEPKAEDRSEVVAAVVEEIAEAGSDAALKELGPRIAGLALTGDDKDTVAEAYKKRRVELWEAANAAKDQPKAEEPAAKKEEPAKANADGEWPAEAVKQAKEQAEQHAKVGGPNWDADGQSEAGF